MNHDDPSQQTSQDADSAASGPRIGRRAAIKAGAATVAGLALGTTYLKPGMISVGVQEVYAVSHVVTVPPTTSELPITAAPAPAPDGKPAALPAAGQGAVASALPGALGLLGLSAAGLGYAASRIQATRPAATAGTEESSAFAKWDPSVSSDQQSAGMSPDHSGDSTEDLT